jgi:hypothetical protein
MSKVKVAQLFEGSREGPVDKKNQSRTNTTTVKWHDVHHKEIVSS